MRMLEIWRLAPKPRRVCAIGEELFKRYLEEKKRSLKNDLGTDWFGRFLAALFKNTPLSGSETFDAYDTSGASHTIEVKFYARSYQFNATGDCDVGCYIGIGTGTTAPTKTDYKLASEVERKAASASYTDGGDYVKVCASFTLSTTTTIWEVGLYYKCGYDHGGSVGPIILLDRTVLDSGVDFEAGVPMGVCYKIAI